MISAIYKFRENISESSPNVSETAPRVLHIQDIIRHDTGQAFIARAPIQYKDAILPV